MSGCERSSRATRRVGRTLSKRLSERLAEVLVAARDREHGHVVMTTGAADELIRLIEAAEAVVELRGDLDPRASLGFDREYYRQLDEAILRIKGILG
jgi:NAD(P)-dependent dehydrogenase (short-subunit alcohol dehydrogenase family)